MDYYARRVISTFVVSSLPQRMRESAGKVKFEKEAGGTGGGKAERKRIKRKRGTPPPVFPVKKNVQYD